MKKILIAEDEIFLANAYKAKLSKEGFEVQIASNGEEALKILETFIPDVIILDLVMPVKDGFATLKEIKNNDSIRSIPVIVASNLGQKEDIDKGMSLGAVTYIIKSDIRLDTLVEKINNVISVKK